eukprot:g14652.t1
MDFEARRAQTLIALSQVSYRDKSPRDRDAPILDLVNLVNGAKSFFTTSSCSGRISLFQNAAGQRKGGRWLLVEHGTVSFAQVLNALSPYHIANSSDGKEDHIENNQSPITGELRKKSEEDVVFRAEPFILSVECQSLESASWLLGIALQSGFRESGITLAKRRILLSMRCHLLLAVSSSFDWRRCPELSATLRDSADRVSLGLLPSSEEGWPIALTALQPAGGWLHVHANVPDQGEAEFVNTLLVALKRIATGLEKGATWMFEVKHVSRVKWFAPRIRHVGFTEKYQWDFGAFRGKQGICNGGKTDLSGLIPLYISKTMLLHLFYEWKCIYRMHQYTTVEAFLSRLKALCMAF